MEAVPRMPMLSFELKQSLEFVEFGPTLKQFIRDHYGEDPAHYNKACTELEQLRQSAVHVSHDFMGCSTLKKYFAQLQFLQGRFPMTEMGEAAIPFTWEDVYSGREVTVSDIKFEQACVLYNIGSLHSILGAMDTRQSADGMKVSCTHFQCAAWAFEHLRDQFGCSGLSLDMSHELLTFQAYIMLAQAQECILEKSMTDSRKSTITAKVAAQIVEFYLTALRHLETCYSQELISSKQNKDWKKRVDLKILFYTCITNYYLGRQAEDQQKWGLSLAHFTVCLNKLQECQKLAKNESQDIQESLRFMNDVVVGKHTASKKDNDFVYHEKVPALDSLPEVKGASLVKGLPFNPSDPEVSGPDIFMKLVPMSAHEAASMYSEEKATLLRRIASEIAEKNEELLKYMSSLQLDTTKLKPEPERLPQQLLEKCAALSVRPSAIKDLVDSMAAVSNVSTEVEMGIKEIQQLLQEESVAELEHQEVFGKRDLNPLLSEVAKECARLEEGHRKGSQSNTDLHKAMNTHISNLKALSSPLEDLQKLLPSLDKEKDPESEDVIKQLNVLLEKIQEMKSQRESLEEQLRKDILNDDITGVLCKQEGGNREALFSEQLKKHEKITSLIRQNLSAQVNILRAMTDANARYARVRQATGETIQRRDQMIRELINSYDVYEDLMAKSQKGLEFYKKVETNVGRLLNRCRGVIKVQQEERQKMVDRYKPKAPTPSRPAASKPSPSVAMAPMSVGDITDSPGHAAGIGLPTSAGTTLPSVSGMFDGPKLKDYLPFMKPKTFGKKDGSPPISTAHPSVQDYLGQGGTSSLPGSGTVSPVHLPQMSGSVPASPEHFRHRLQARLGPGSKGGGQPSPDLTQGHSQYPSLPSTPDGPLQGQSQVLYGQRSAGQESPMTPVASAPSNHSSFMPYSQANTAQYGHFVVPHNQGQVAFGNFGNQHDGQISGSQNVAPASQYVPLDQKWKRDTTPVSAVSQPFSTMSQAPGAVSQYESRSMPPYSQSVSQPPIMGEHGGSAAAAAMGQTIQSQQQHIPHSQPAPGQPVSTFQPQNGSQPQPVRGQGHSGQGQGYLMPREVTNTVSALGTPVFSPQTQAAHEHDQTQLGQGQVQGHIPHGQDLPHGQQLSSQQMSIQPQQQFGNQPRHSLLNQLQEQQFLGGSNQFNLQPQAQQHRQQQISQQYPQQQQQYANMPVSNAKGVSQQPAGQQHQLFQQKHQQQQGLTSFSGQMTHMSAMGPHMTHAGIPTSMPYSGNSGQQFTGMNQASLSNVQSQTFSQTQNINQSGAIPQQQPHQQQQQQPPQQQQQSLQQHKNYQQIPHSTVSLQPFPPQQPVQQQQHEFNKQQQTPYPGIQAQYPSPAHSPMPQGYIPQSFVAQQQAMTHQNTSMMTTTLPTPFSQAGKALPQNPQQQLTSQYQEHHLPTSLHSQMMHSQTPGQQQQQQYYPAPQQQQQQQLQQHRFSNTGPYLPGQSPHSVALQSQYISPAQSPVPRLSTPTISQNISNQQPMPQHPSLSSLSQLPQQSLGQYNMTGQFIPSQSHSQPVNLQTQMVTSQHLVAELQGQHRQSQVSQSQQFQSQGHFPQNINQGSPLPQGQQLQQPSLNQGQGLQTHQAMNVPGVPVQPSSAAASGSMPMQPSSQPGQIPSQNIPSHQPLPQDSTAAYIGQAGYLGQINAPMLPQNQSQGQINALIQQGKPEIVSTSHYSGQAAFVQGHGMNQTGYTLPVLQPQIETVQQTVQAIQPIQPTTGMKPIGPTATTLTVQSTQPLQPAASILHGHEGQGPLQQATVVQGPGQSAGFKSTPQSSGVSSPMTADKGFVPDISASSDVKKLEPKPPVTSSRPIPVDRQLSTASSLDEILSASPDARGQQTDTVLAPKVLTAQEIQQQKEDQLKNSSVACLVPPKDPYQEQRKLNKFVEEVEKLAKFIEGLEKPSCSGPTPLDVAWKDIMEEQEKASRTLKLAIARCYPMKNRDQDVMPYDDSRVLLDTGNDDYINASWVNDLSPLCPKFIATQAPLPHTLVDFWLMVYEQGVEVLVQISSENETGKKFPVYLPEDKGESVEHGPVQLTLQSVKQKACWTERILHLRHSETRTGRTLVHVHYNCWPVSGFPEKTSHMLQFITEVHSFYRQQRSLLKPIVVHCSNGVGRTGMFLMTYVGMQVINHGDGIINITEVAGKMLWKRRNLLLRKDQLKFCYEALLYFAQDVLAKKGILVHKASFGDQLPKPGVKSQSWEPGEDILFGSMSLSNLQTNIAKMASKKNDSAKLDKKLEMLKSDMASSGWEEDGSNKAQQALTGGMNTERSSGGSSGGVEGGNSGVFSIGGNTEYNGGDRSSSKAERSLLQGPSMDAMSMVMGSSLPDVVQGPGLTQEAGRDQTSDLHCDMDMLSGLGSSPNKGVKQVKGQGGQVLISDLDLSMGDLEKLKLSESKGSNSSLASMESGKPEKWKPLSLNTSPAHQSREGTASPQMGKQSERSLSLAELTNPSTFSIGTAKKTRKITKSDFTEGRKVQTPDPNDPLGSLDPFLSLK